MKKQLALLMALLMICLTFTACSGKETTQPSAAPEAEQSGETQSTVDVETVIEKTVALLGNTEETFEEPQLLQLQDAPKGNPTATLHTTMGDITVVLYPEQAPQAVENFLTLAEEGYYDGISFHRVINNFMIQGGDPTATGSGGESKWGHDFEDEFYDGLHNFRGALSMANAGINTNGSQFFIVQCRDKVSDADAQACLNYIYQNSQLTKAKNLYAAYAASGASMEDQQTFVDALNAKLQEMASAGVPENQLKRFEGAVEAYKELGGTPHLDYVHTVFGHVISGMDVVDAIAAVATDDANKPVEDVLINSITLSTVQ